MAEFLQNTPISLNMVLMLMQNMKMIVFWWQYIESIE